MVRIALDGVKQYSVIKMKDGRVGVVDSKAVMNGQRRICFGEGRFAMFSKDSLVEVLKTPYELAICYLFEQMYLEVEPGEAKLALAAIAKDSEGKQLNKTHAQRYASIAKKALGKDLSLNERSYIEAVGVAV